MHKPKTKATVVHACNQSSYVHMVTVDVKWMHSDLRGINYTKHGCTQINIQTTFL